MAAAGSATAKYELFGRVYHKLHVEGEEALSKEDVSEALAFLKDAAKNHGHANALYSYGCVHFEGLMNVKQDHAKAVKLWGKAASQGCEPAKEKLANSYFKGLGVERNILIGKQTLRSMKVVEHQNSGYVQEQLAKAEQGCVTSQLHLASIYGLGSHGAPLDWEEAWYWVRMAGGGDDAHGQYSLGGWYDAGMYGGAQDRYMAAALWIKAAAQNHVMATANLAVYYESGLGGLPRDLGKAAELLRKAADGGNGIAQLNLGDYYMVGRGGLECDISKAVTLWQQSAEHGLTDSYNRLADCYMYGIGVEQSWTAATSYLVKAACQGDKEATRRLCITAQNHLTGEAQQAGLAKDLKRARLLFKICAEQGDAYAIAALGSRDCAACGAKNPTKACPLCICTNYCSKVGRWQRIIILHRYRL